LIAKGHEQCARAGALLRELAYDLESIVSSPYRRARETAKGVLHGFRRSVALRFDRRLEPASDVGAFLELVRGLGDGDVLLVGHEPQLSSGAAALLGAQQLQIDLRKAGLIELELGRSGDAFAASLCGLIRPRHLTVGRKR
jgi:phosphohistidine phosphatase